MTTRPYTILVAFPRELEPQEKTLLGQHFREPEVSMIQTASSIRESKGLGVAVDQCGANAVLVESSAFPRDELAKALESMSDSGIPLYECREDGIGGLRLDEWFLDIGEPSHVTRIRDNSSVI